MLKFQKSEGILPEIDGDFRFAVFSSKLFGLGVVKKAEFDVI